MTRSNPEELLAAWAHRPEDLSAEERLAVEALLARDGGARADADADRALIARVAALPTEGVEPAWSDLAAAIRDALPAPAVPVPSLWSRWRAWIAASAGGGLIAAAAAIALFVSAGETLSPTVDHLARVRPAPTASALLVPPTIESLDDAAVVDLLSVVEEDPEVADDTAATDEAPADVDLAWIDTLDDTSVDTLVHWLSTQPG